MVMRLFVIFVSFQVTGLTYTFKHFKIKNLNKYQVKNSSLSGDLPSLDDKKMAPLISTLKNYLKLKYKNIAQNKSDEVDSFNNKFDLGSVNYSGYNWQKPFGYFSVYSIRNIAPDLFNIDRWIVSDTLTITIDAKTYLERLKNEGAISIRSADLGAFAGVKFKRVYKYVHFASSYQEGLFADPSKLFLNFLYVNPSHLKDMHIDEVMSKEDYITTEAGAYASLPLQYGFAIEAGGKLNFEKMSHLMVQKKERNDNSKENEIRLSFEKKKGKKTSGELELALDFLNLLKISLLSYDLEYKYLEEASYQYSLTKEDILSEDKKTQEEIRKIFMLNVFEPESLADKKMSEELRITETLKNGYSALWSAGSNSEEKEFIKISKKEKDYLFMNSSKGQVEEKKNIFAGLLQDFVDSISEIPLHIEDSIESLREKIHLEFESISHHEKHQLVKNQSIDLTINFEFRAQMTDHKMFKSTKQRSLDFVEYKTLLDKKIYNAIRNNTLIGPLRIQSKVKVSKEGFDYLMAKSKKEFNGDLMTICRYLGSINWQSPEENDNACVRDILIPYRELQKVRGLSLQTPNRYENLGLAFKAYVTDLGDYMRLFNEDNIKISGSFFSKTSEGKFFQTYFIHGASQSRGIVNDFSNIPSI